MENINRRGFLKSGAATVVVTSACLCGLGGLSGCATITKVGDTPEIGKEAFTLANGILSIDLSKEAALAEVGGSVKIKHAQLPDGIIIANVDRNRYEIASLLCTHRGVEVEYNQDENNFTCASLGNSKFSLDGGNIGGPAEKPLKNYEAELQGQNLVIRL